MNGGKRSFVNNLIRALTLALILSLDGCSSGPSMVQQIQTPAPSSMTNFSDYGVLIYTDSVKQSWGVRSLTSETLSLGGGLALAGLSTAALATAGQGSSRGLLAGANFLLVAMGIIKPGDRDNALNAGSGLILDSEGEYVVNLTAAGFCTVPTDRLTVYGAVLLQKTNAAIKTTNSLIAGLLPTLQDLQSLAPMNAETIANVRGRMAEQPSCGTPDNKPPAARVP